MKIPHIIGEQNIHITSQYEGIINIISQYEGIIFVPIFLLASLLDYKSSL